MSALDDVQLELDNQILNSAYYDPGAVYCDRLVNLPGLNEYGLTVEEDDLSTQEEK